MADGTNDTIDPENIYLLEAVGAETVLDVRPLGTLESLFLRHRFVRIHCSFIGNLHRTRLRSVAAWTLAHLGPHIDKAALRPLTLTPIEEDIDDELKGNALRCTWPEHLSIHELFNALTPPRNRNLYGA